MEEKTWFIHIWKEVHGGLFVKRFKCQRENKSMLLNCSYSIEVYIAVCFVFLSSLITFLVFLAYSPLFVLHVSLVLPLPFLKFIGRPVESHFCICCIHSLEIFVVIGPFESLKFSLFHLQILHCQAE